MLPALAIRGFRGFKSYRLDNLARVNLLVGGNGCGKTSVLEAVELLLAAGQPDALVRSLRRREDVGARAALSPPDASHIFFGHKCVPGSSFYLASSDGNRTLSVKIVSLHELDLDFDFQDPEVWRDPRRSRYASDGETTPVFGMSIERASSAESVWVPVFEDGALLLGTSLSRFHPSASGTPVHFLTLEAFDPESMGGLWDTVLTKGTELEIVEDMRLLESRLDSIHFMNRSSRILIGVRNEDRRLPIGVYGDGMRRLLALRLAFEGAKDGVLLVDEIDAGLHWTIMEDMWQFVVEVARRWNVQVFATTRSYDCIRGLGTMIRSRPDLMNHVFIQKIDASLKQAACLGGEQVMVAVEQDIEVR